MNSTPPGCLTTDELRRTFGFAWVGLAAALALHVIDEALTDFLSFYNPAVAALRSHLPWLPLPTFTFGWWLAGLGAGIAILLALGPAARRGGVWIVRLALPLSAIMVANALGHMVGSVYLHRFLPGVFSSPLLLAAALFVLVSAWRFRAMPRAGTRFTPGPVYPD